MSRVAWTISPARVHHLRVIGGTSDASSAHDARTSENAGR
jgi:hypothetical protein